MWLLCIKIFLVRIMDVSLGTLRTMFTVKGKKLIASSVGFFEVLLWFLIVREALSTNDSSIFVAISYAGGFATGTYIGGFLSSKLINGNVSLNVFTGNYDLVNHLRDHGYAVSVINYIGRHDETKYMLYITVDKKHEKKVRKKIMEIEPNAFIVENEANYVANGYYKY